MARAGMSNLLTRLRREVDDAGTATWTDDELQDMFDGCRVEFYDEKLIAEPVAVDGDEVYVYYRSAWSDLEEAPSGSDAWRVYDASGSAIGTADYSVNYRAGVITFAADQGGSARYLHGRSYDLACAAAEAWSERAAGEAGGYDFTADGGKFTRSQWFKHCREMADYFTSRQRITVATIVRSDVNV